MSKLIGRPGPITGLMLAVLDIIVSLFLKLAFNLMKISTFAFGWVNNLTFGNFKSLIPSSYRNGKVISMKFFRYGMTVLMPPFGVMLAKGFYGWFSIIVCCVITYVNFLAGMIYAFVITSRNRYADQYEQQDILKSMDQGDYTQIHANAAISAFASSVSFICILGLIIYGGLSYF